MSDIKTQFKDTLTAISNKIDAVFSALKKNIKFAVYATKDGSIVINTPSDTIAAGDAVQVEVNGELQPSYTTAEPIVVVGAAGTFEIEIADGVVKEVEEVKVESEQEQPQEQPQEQEQEPMQEMQQLSSHIQKLVEMNNEIVLKLNSLEKETTQLRERVQTLWTASQKSQNKNSASKSYDWMRNEFNKI